MEQAISVGILAIYFGLVLYIGLWAWRRFPQTDTESYILGGRGIGWLVAGFTLMATQYSALTFLGFPGTMYRSGLGGYVAITGMYIGFAALYWLVFAARTWKVGRAFGHITPADTFSHFYESRWVGYVLGAILIATLIPYIQVQIIGIGILFDVATDGLIPFTLGTVIVYAVIILYVFLGGMRSVAYVDTFQGVLLFGGLVVGALLVAFAAADGPLTAMETVTARSPELVSLPGPGGVWTWPFLISWVIPVGVGWTMHPHMWIRMHIPKSVNFIRLWPMLITLSFPIVMGAAFLVGMAGQVERPGLTEQAATDTVMISMILDHFPLVLGAFVAAAGLAAMMSSVSSQVHGVGASVGVDFLSKWVPGQPERQRVLYTRMAVLVVALIGLYLSLTEPAFLTELGAFAAAWGAQAAPIAVASLAGWKWTTKWGAIVGALGGTVAMLWVGLGTDTQAWRGIYAGSWGLIVNITLFVVVSLLTPGARPSTQRVAEYRAVGW
jgi:SSS family solute:Na+ symporter